MHGVDSASPTTRELERWVVYLEHWSGLENLHVYWTIVLAAVTLNPQGEGGLNFLFKHVGILHLVQVRSSGHSPPGDAILEAFLLPQINTQLGD